MAKFQFANSGFVINLNLTANQLVAVATFPIAFPGFGAKVKGVFKLNPADDITSLKLFNSKGILLASYAAFSNPTPVDDFIADLDTVFDTVGDIFPPFYAFWNGFLDGDFKLTMSTPFVTDVGTGGVATIVGSKGGDRVVVFQQKDVTFNGGKGADTVSFSPLNGDPTLGATIDLAAPTNNNPYGGTITLSNVENLFGTDFNDDFRGNAANNIFDGGFGGVDQLRGEGGNDTLIFLPIGADSIGVADGGDGVDTLTVFVSGSSDNTHILDLVTPANNAGVFDDATVTNIEIFRLAETDTATSFTFRGTDAGETVFGGNGGDELFGNGGNDVLVGGTNTNSPATRDDMTGGTGADRFVFSSSLDSPSGASFDIIHDFSHAEGDKIDLRGIDANFSQRGNQAFTFIGTKVFSGKLGELRIEASGDDIFVQGNVIGNTAFDFIIRADDLASLVKGDFLL